MTLVEARVLFTMLTSTLPIKAAALGLGLAWGECLRPPAVAKYYAATGQGEEHSAHLNGLAVDTVLYKDGEPLKKTEEYAELGEWWKSLHPLCRWGGDFKTRKDGNHFSLEYGGIQ